MAPTIKFPSQRVPYTTLLTNKDNATRWVKVNTAEACAGVLAQTEFLDDYKNDFKKKKNLYEDSKLESLCRANKYLNPNDALQLYALLTTKNKALAIIITNGNTVIKSVGLGHEHIIDQYGVEIEFEYRIHTDCEFPASNLLPNVAKFIISQDWGVKIVNNTSENDPNATGLAYSSEDKKLHDLSRLIEGDTFDGSFIIRNYRGKVLIPNNYAINGHLITNNSYEGELIIGDNVKIRGSAYLSGTKLTCGENLYICGNGYMYRTGLLSKGLYVGKYLYISKKQTPTIPRSTLVVEKVMVELYSPISEDTFTRSFPTVAQAGYYLAEKQINNGSKLTSKYQKSKSNPWEKQYKREMRPALKCVLSLVAGTGPA